MKEWFDSWFDSNYYHLLYANRDENEAADFVNHVISYLNLPEKSKILDIACGKGRLSKVFADNGFIVDGFDLSQNSISEANKKAIPNASFYEHDMRRLFRTNYYDLAINFFTSFGYFKNERENMLVAKAMAINIKKNGILMIDFVNKIPGIKNIENKKTEFVETTNIKFEVNRFFENNFFKKKIKVIDNNNEFIFEESLQSFTLQQFKTIFEPLGLQLINTFGNYNLEKYEEETSPRMIMLFKK
ncbi:MAG: class I SAM-dependent methyltransferase [Chitinophagaceae bacterium]|nr:class I SAM-dependent methyltransferase [Chitinophagaceae bacterium]